MLLKGVYSQSTVSTSTFSQRRMACIFTTIGFALFLLLGASYNAEARTHIGRILASSATPTIDRHHWVTTWAAAQQGVAPGATLPQALYIDGVSLRNATIRQTLRLTLGTDVVRVELSNVFTSVELVIDHATIAMPAPEPVSGETTLSGSPGIQPTTLQTLTFGGREQVTIPANAQMFSDPVDLQVRNGEDVTISLYLSEGQKTNILTCHLSAKTNTWFSPGNQVAEPTFRRDTAGHTTAWYFVSAVDAWKPADYHSVVILGDSITDSSRATINANGKWVDHLFDRLQDSSEEGLQKLSILNQAIGGNQLLQNGAAPNLNARLDRDALALRGVKFAVVVQGIIDMGAGRDHESAFIQLQQVVSRFHSANIPVFGSTLHPFSCTTGQVPWKGSNLPASEAERLKMNSKIRNVGVYDVVIDYDAVLRDPRNATETAEPFKGDDCLHLSPRGFDEMTRTFPIDAFRQFMGGVDGYS